MHIRSTDKQFAILNQGDNTEKHKQQLIDYTKEEMSHLVFLEDKLIDPTNNEKQLGTPLTSQELEKKLSTILPSNITFIDHPWNPTKKAIVRVNAFNSLETICPYERGFMPEHSVMQLVEKEVADVDVLARRKSISRKDMPKSEFVPGQGFVFDPTVTRPGFKRIKQVGREVKRGWRTVLLKLIHEGLVTITEVEKVFTPDVTASWQQHTGRRNNNLPW